jgi:hypothetical protein
MEGEHSMKKLAIALLVAACAPVAIAQDALKQVDRPSGSSPLDNFVGHWTLEGKEGNYLEVCEWYHGQFHIVCNTESKRADGSTGHSLSILSYVPDQGYVYTGIGSKGRYETMQGGTFVDGVLEFLSETDQDGGKVLTRVRMGPFSETGTAFVVDSSADGGPWTVLDSITYVRIK